MKHASPRHRFPKSPSACSSHTAGVACTRRSREALAGGGKKGENKRQATSHPTNRPTKQQSKQATN